MKSTIQSRQTFMLKRKLLPAVISALLASGYAQAQQDAKKVADEKAANEIDTIVVTATKRAAPLQSVPIAITVISGAQLEKSNLNTLGSITSQTPTVNFRAGASNKDTSLFIRGVGTITTSPGVEPTVSTVIDGVVTARPGQATMDLLDVDRVEVLRGPQGTLFGKNASAGVISIVTREPSKEFESSVDMSYFQGNEKRVRVSASGQIQPNVMSASLSAMHGDYKGNVLNVADGSTVNGYKRNGMRGKLNITPNKDMKFSFIADYMKANDNGPTGVPVKAQLTSYPALVLGPVNTNFLNAVAPVVPSASNRNINSNMETRVEDTNWGLSGQLDWTLGTHTLTAISAYRKWENTQFQDQDRLPLPYKQFTQTGDKGTLDFKQFTQEIRIASPKGQFFDYVAGAFYMDAKNRETYRRDVTRCAATTAPALPSGLVPCTAASTTVDYGDAKYGIVSDSASLFGEGAFNFSESFRAIAGARYTTDELSYDHQRVSNQPGDIPGVRKSYSSAGSTKVTGYSGRFGPQFDFSKNAMAYATISRGYKGPAYNVFFNMQAFDELALKPELSTSYEVGLKSTILNNTVRLNVAAFDTTYDNYQANLNDLVGTTIVTRLINAGRVYTKGMEMDFAAKVSKNFTFSGAAARIFARIDQFNCPPGASASCNVNGKPLPFSPDWKVNVRGNYKMQVENGWTLDLGADYSWQSQVQYDIGQAPDAIQPAYGIVNATISAYNSGNGWSVALVGKNLANQSYAAALANGGGFFVRVVPRDDQRYFGITVRKDF
jgi:iron complex outermembrane receptor protein